MSEPQFAAVASLRARAWDAGLRPVAVYNYDASVAAQQRGKAPKGDGWRLRALQDPPEAAVSPPDPDALNTGILCDGLRAIDLDIDDPAIAHQCRNLALARFGEAPVRVRNGSPRCLILYRAAEGEPKKIVMAGSRGKIEILGQGQQFVAWGRHYPSGSVLEWFPEAPGETLRESIPAVTEQGIAAYLEECRPIVGAERAPKANGSEHISGPPKSSVLLVANALAILPNDGPPDWDAWNRIGMAAWAATDGSPLAFEAFNDWSSRHPSYDAAATADRWQRYTTSPPDRIGAGTIFREAIKAGWQRPGTASDQDPSDPQNTVDRPRSTTERYREPLPLVFYDAIEKCTDTIDFVEDVLIERGACVIYGESNTGKTFFATDIALHVAAGRRWRDKEVEQGGVVYLSLEGSMGFRNRVAAWRMEIGDDTKANFAAVMCAVDLLHPDADVPLVIQAIKSSSQHFEMSVKLVVIDTLSRAMAGGNENAPDDMGALVQHQDEIRTATGACVMWIHHSGKDAAKGARGHSLLRAAIDTEIEVSADGLSRNARISKQRDLVSGQEFPFNLKTVELGTNTRDKPVTSCVVEHILDTSNLPAARRERLKGHTKTAYEILCDAVASAGVGGFRGTPTGAQSIPEEWWRERFYDSAMPGAEPATKKKTFRRAADHLVASHFVGMRAGRVWLAFSDRGTDRGTTEGTEGDKRDDGPWQ